MGKISSSKGRVGLSCKGACSSASLSFKGVEKADEVAGDGICMDLVVTLRSTISDTDFGVWAGGGASNSLNNAANSSSGGGGGF